MESRNKVTDSESAAVNTTTTTTTSTNGQTSANDQHGSPIGSMPFVPSKAYATRKTVAQGALDFALLMANASQLKALVDIPSNNRGNFYEALLVLLGLSITLQVSAGLVLLILGMTDPTDEPSHKRTERLNNASVCLILIITVINVFISAFGISYTDGATDTTNGTSP